MSDEPRRDKTEVQPESTRPQGAQSPPDAATKTEVVYPHTTFAPSAPSWGYTQNVAKRKGPPAPYIMIGVLLAAFLFMVGAFAGRFTAEQAPDTSGEVIHAAVRATVDALPIADPMLAVGPTLTAVAVAFEAEVPTRVAATIAAQRSEAPTETAVIVRTPTVVMVANTPTLPMPATSTPNLIPEATVPPPPTAAPIEIKGHGQRVSDALHLTAGLAIFHLKHLSGKSNFIIYLADSNADNLKLLSNEIGPADVWGLARVSVEGIYYLKVEADGDWAATITQAKGTYSEPPAFQEFRGHGSGVTPLFSMKPGPTRFKGVQLNGTAYFEAEIQDQATGSVSLKAKERGPVTVEVLEGVGGGAVVMAVINTDGDWILTIQQQP